MTHYHVNFNRPSLLSCLAWFLAGVVVMVTPMMVYIWRTRGW